MEINGRPSIVEGVFRKILRKQKKIRLSIRSGAGPGSSPRFHQHLEIFNDNLEFLEVFASA
ncbi:MAG TPA: hypothetical protein VGD78_02310, partial [Chthoniobacterales bacterium]